MMITKKVRFGRRQVPGKHADEKPLAAVVPLGRIPRISRLMALAIRYEGLLTTGAVASQSNLAELLHITQPRMTQIMNLNHLAPDIQEALLFLPPVTNGHDPVTEWALREVAAEVNWAKQRGMWRNARVSA